MLVKHPQANGQAKATNKVILEELKKWLDGAKGRWAKELAKVLLANKCTPQSITQETHFRLTYGTNMMLSIEVEEVSLWRHYFIEDENNEALRIDVDIWLNKCEKMQSLWLKPASNVRPNASTLSYPSTVWRRGPSLENMQWSLEGPIGWEVGGQLGRALQSSTQLEEWSLEVRRTIR